MTSHRQVFSDDLTADQVRQLLIYDPETGKFRWRHRRSGVSFEREPGAVDKRLGYRSVGIHRRTYLMHRIAWLYVYGAWPTKEIDHINRDPSDNRIENLREATRSEQLRNTHGQKRRAAKFKGTQKRKWCRGWHAKITIAGKVIQLGMFATAEEAHAVYVEAAKRFHGAYANSGEDAL